MTHHSIRRTLGSAVAAATLAVLPVAGLGAASAHSSTATPTWITASGKTVNLTLISGYNQNIAGFNFNGYGKGMMTVTVPTGAKVIIKFSNKASLPHSVAVTAYAKRTAMSFPDAFMGSHSPNPTQGITAGHAPQMVTFTANKAGTYAIVCAVPGHAAAGMWDTLKVVNNAKAAISTSK